MKRRIVLSGVSVLLVFCLLVGASFAWFTDTEKTGANFSAGVLDAILTPENPNEEGAIDYTNLRPLTLAQLEASFQNGTPVGNLEDVADGYLADNLPLYFHKIHIENAGSLPMRVSLSVESSGPCSETNLPQIVENGSGGVKNEGKQAACDNSLADVLQLLLYQQDAEGTLVPVNCSDGTQAVVWKDGQAVTYLLPETLAAGADTDYIVAAWLPGETVGNEYQAKHFHGEMVVSAVQPDTAVAEEPSEEVWDGESVEPVIPEGNVYKIATGSQLAWVAQQVNTQHASWQDREHFSNKKLIQVADIDLGGHEFPGIGADINYYFGGTYDGQGYSIKNFTINRPDSATGNYAGIFNYIRGAATVKNLTVSDATITGYSNVGGIVGYVYGGTVENCKNYATVQKVIGPSGGAGGIVGATGVSSNEITNCHNYGTIKGWGYLGGVLGSSINTGSNVSLSISGCSNQGAIVPDEGKEEYAGNFAGHLEDYVEVDGCKVLDTAYPVIVASGSSAGIEVLPAEQMP